MLQVGQRVAAGEPVLTFEAMKLYHTLSAPLSGTVQKIHVGVGDVVGAGWAGSCPSDRVNAHTPATTSTPHRTRKPARDAAKKREKGTPVAEALTAEAAEIGDGGVAADTEARGTGGALGGSGA